jgi:microcin C transport system substrate-binding protein
MKLIRLIPLIVFALPLIGCGGGSDTAGPGAPAAGPPSPTATTDASASDTVEPTTTRYVQDLPTYESHPLPEGLVWETNTDDPTFASPDAKRGGVFHTWTLSFPLTLRPVGPDSNDSFSAYLRTMSIAAPLVGIHPNTLKYIPMLATEWAFGPDGKTVYYRLNKDARWSDGLPITADDYLFALDFMRSKYIVDPWYNTYYTQQIVNVVKYDDYTISVEGASPKPKEEIINEYSLAPMPRQFHKLDEHWVEDYNWRIPPSSGPYTISRIEKGQYVEFKRNPDWWGDKNKYLAHRYNPDIIRVTVIRDMNVAWDYFLRGELDTFGVIFPNYWHDKAKGELFDKGYIDKITYYTDTPQPSQGMWLNTDDPILADINVRLGLAYSMNVDLMLKTVLRGDYERLKQAYDGYWDYTDETIKPRPFDLAKANEYFDKAGWTTRGPDGIRTKNGQRLSLNVSYATQEYTPRLVLLREEAKKAGVELNLQLMDSAAAFKQALEKKHQIAWMGWSTSLTPQFWGSFYSSNAHKPQTNNITNTADPELDKMIMAYRNGTDRATRVELAHKIERKIYDLAVFIPMYKVPYTREAYWRWMKLPATYGTRTSDALFDPLAEGFGADGLFWIDQDAKKETLEARASGRTFPPVNIVDETWHVK